MPRGPGAPRVRKNGRWHGRWRGYGRGRRRSLGFVATRAMHAALRVAFATFRGAAAVGDRLLHAKLPNLARTGALANVSAELEKLSAKIDAVEKELGDTVVELRTARKNGNTDEAGHLSKREEQLRDEKKQLRDEKKQLRDKEKLLLEERKLLLERTRPPAAGASPRRSGPHMTAWPKCVAQARSQAF